MNFEEPGYKQVVNLQGRQALWVWPNCLTDKKKFSEDGTRDHGDSIEQKSLPRVQSQTCSRIFPTSWCAGLGSFTMST